MDLVYRFIAHFIEPSPHAAFIVILNLIVIESLLSVDNAAVLATLVMHLPNKDRRRALRIGILFAYIFRGLALIFASFLIKITWLKLLGGGYLIYLCFDFFYAKIADDKSGPTDPLQDPKKSRKLPGLSLLWSTVVMVELMDITFSIDNVFAAVAFTDNIYLVCTGVFIGIITMRIVAGYFVKLMNRFPFLDSVAFAVIGLLGLRLFFDFCCVYFTHNPICNVLALENADMYFSALTSIIFFLPIITSLLFGIPRGKQ